MRLYKARILYFREYDVDAEWVKRIQRKLMAPLADAFLRALRILSACRFRISRILAKSATDILYLLKLRLQIYGNYKRGMRNTSSFIWSLFRMSYSNSVEILFVSIQRAIPFQYLHLHDRINPSRWIPTVLFIVCCIEAYRICMPFQYACWIGCLFVIWAEYTEHR